MPVLGAAQAQDRLDRYQLVERIGRGGMAEVFRARVQSLGGFERDVAVKVLLPQFACEPEFVDMLLDEARIAGAIVHPCVVQVLDVGRQGDVFYIVMEYVNGCDLRSIARGVPGGKLPLPLALFAISEVLRGLDAVHNAVDDQGKPRRIVHRDVSPANVLVDDAGAVKLGDFGIAHASGRLTRTRTGSIKGKSRYMAPEQLTGRPVDHRADLYAVGVTLFEALLGDVARESSFATPYGPMFTWPRRLPPELIPDDVAAILRRAVVEDPGARFASAAEFRRAVVQSLLRYAPGYDAEVLARDLRRLRGEPTDPGPDLADGTDVATELRTGRPRLALVAETRPNAVAVAPPAPAPSVAAPYAAPYAAAYAPANEPGLYAEPELRTTSPFAARWPFRVGTHKLVLSIAGAIASAALIAIVVVLASGSSAPLPVTAPPARPVPQVMPLGPPHVSNGRLAVAGPEGARVSIGATVYPPAPCTIDLPPGEYAVRVRAHRRSVVHHVTIEAGQTTTL